MKSHNRRDREQRQLRFDPAKAAELAEQTMLHISSLRREARSAEIGAWDQSCCYLDAYFRWGKAKLEQDQPQQGLQPPSADAGGAGDE